MNPNLKPFSLARSLDDLSKRPVQRVGSHQELLRDAAECIRQLYQLCLDGAVHNLREHGVEIVEPTEKLQ
jgi:hypothetical protein